jgi:hypothetical protein
MLTIDVTARINLRTQTGLFAATVGGLLTISIPDLKPDPQDTSTFYLANIYQVFANPNVSHATIPPTLPQPPAFSPPRYAIWVNSLWFLSLAISLSGATVATLGQQWAHRYITITQHPRYTPEERARIRAIFSENALGPYSIWGAGLSHRYLHFSLFLFLAGGLIYLFNLSHAAFGAVAWWIAIAMIGYTFHTVDAILTPENLFYTPLAPSASRLYLFLSNKVFQVCSIIKTHRRLCDDARERCHAQRSRYRDGFLVGKWKQIEEKASKPSLEIDSTVIERTLLALDNDDALGKFFDAIPGFCNSTLRQGSLLPSVQTKIRQALDGFLGRTFASDSVSNLVKSERLITCLNAAHAALGREAPSQIILGPLWNQIPQSIEMGHALIRWCTGTPELIAELIRWLITGILASVRERDDRWHALAMGVFGLPEHALRNHSTHGDSVLLSILIHITRPAIRTGSLMPWILSSHPRFDIRETLPGLQHEFCMLWNEIAQEARNEGTSSALVHILDQIRHSFTALHQATDAAPTRFPSAIDDDSSLSWPGSYPLCHIASHRPDFTPPPFPHPIPFGHSPGVSSQPTHSESQPHPTRSPGMVVAGPIPGNADISSTSGITNPISRSISDRGPAQQHVDETRTASSSVTFNLIPTQIATPSLSHGATAIMPPSYMDSGITRTDHMVHPPGIPTSFSAIAPLSAPPQVITVYVIVGTRAAGTHEDSHDPNPPLPMETFPHLSQSAPSPPDIVVTASQPLDPLHGPTEL